MRTKGVAVTAVDANANRMIVKEATHVTSASGVVVVHSEPTRDANGGE